jgi:hypothetical protein
MLLDNSEKILLDNSEKMLLDNSGDKLRLNSFLIIIKIYAIF